MIASSRPIFRIAVTLPVSGTFSYSIPAQLVPVAKIGSRVLAPFKNRKVIGYILEKEDGNPGNIEEIKDILGVLDQEPLFHPVQVPFLKWMADYYLYPIGRLIQSALPGGLNVNPSRAVRLTEKGEAALTSSEIHHEDKKLLSWIKENAGGNPSLAGHEIQYLKDRRYILVEERPGRNSVGPLRRKFIRFKEGVDIGISLPEGEGRIKAGNEEEFFKALSIPGGLPLAEIMRHFSNGSRLVDKWLKKGIIEKYDRIVFRDPVGDITVPVSEPPFLFDQQKKALNKIRGYLDKASFSSCLLYGVTGSGKTEVYYNAVEETIRRGKQAILMVPEIALAIYTDGIFRSRLGNRLAIFHSGLSGGERYDQWMKMVRGDADLVIGARSALFAPLPRLGLIIIDEEYDSSYKQEENPRYQARDAAVVRARIENALIILGSGTPSIQSFHNTATGKYQLLSMPERIENRHLPEIEIVDMKKESGEGKNIEILSITLRKALENNLEQGNQAMLFLNRRGFGRIFLCRACGKVVKCPNCDLTLTYHHGDRSLVCHYCGFHIKPGKECPACGLDGMKVYGFGTEKLEMELSKIFPMARISRMDRDSTRRKGQSLKILKAFREREIDILVGTQMITKGYDFPHVTLVGVIAADLSLAFPDFRAGERTFQLLTQVAGRSGRGDQKGRVIIQTFNPGHYAIVAAKNHDYNSFFNKEKELRQQLGYPPFSYLACLLFRGNDQKATEEKASQVGIEIRGLLKGWKNKGRDIKVLGPVEAPLSKLKGKYRYHILLKSKSTELLHYLLKEVEGSSKNLLRKSGVSMITDVDPYQML